MYFVYMLECENNSIYTGITSDVKRRFNEHIDTKKGRKGAKFTMAFKPKRILAVFSAKDRSSALKLEYNIKRQSRTDKLQIIDVFKNEHLLMPNKEYVSSTKIKHLIDS